MTDPLVIIGAGQAGLQLAASARAAGFTAPITMVGAEAHLPYARPPLSKAFLLGKQAADALTLQSAKFFEQKDIDLRTNSRAIRIDRQRRYVICEDGGELPYGKLALATGSRPRPLALYETRPANLFYLRDLGDAQRLKAAVPHARSAVVIGGGFIGLEFAAVARSLGLSVSVIEAGARLMARATSPITAGYFEQAHRARGVRVLLDASARALEIRQDRVTAVVLDSGEAIAADLVVVGIGGLANDALAQACGLECRDGVLVNPALQTADPNVFAIGDCARIQDADRGLRMESVQNAVDQGRYLAKRLSGAPALPYAAVPWFWSDQFDLKLQIAGLPDAISDTVIRDDAHKRSFGAYHFDADRLVCVETVNDAAAHVTARMILDRGIRVHPEQAADSSFDLRQLLKAPTPT